MYTRFKQHMLGVHRSDIAATCTKCGTVFHYMKRYKEHVDVCMKGSSVRSSEDSLLCDTQCTSADPSVDEQYNSQSISHQPDALSVVVDLCRVLQGKHKCSAVAVDDTVISIQELLSAVNVRVDLTPLVSDKSRLRYYEQLGLYLQACEVILPQGSKAYYVPLRKLIANLMMHPEMLAHFQNSAEHANDSRLRDFKDGLRYKNHPVLKHYMRNCLSILLYCDDVEIANPLGMKRGMRGKLTLFYCAFANLPPCDRSKLSTIFLLAVGYSKDLKSDAAKSVLLKDTVETVNELSSEGILFDTASGPTLFRGCLLAYIGDSLAAHNIGGFKESFSVNVRLSCRVCTVPTIEFPRYHFHWQCPLRTDAGIDSQVAELDAAKTVAERRELSSKFGLNSKSVLSSVNHFSLVTDILYDPMHILLEGVIPKEISLFLQYMVRDAGYMSRKTLNETLGKFTFAMSVSKTDYPRPVESDFSLVTSASASLVFILHLPLILDQFIQDENEPHTQCLLLLCWITQIVLSPIITADGMSDLENLIAEHHECYIQCYGQENFIPKMHMMVHLVQQIKHFGPSRHHWAMRFEGKNALPKSKKFFNFKNMPLSVSNFYQTNTSLLLWEGTGKPRSISDEHRVLRYTGPFQLSADFVSAGLPEANVNNVGVSVDRIVLHNVHLATGDVMVLDTGNTDICFVAIKKIVTWNNLVFFVCSLMSVLDFNKKLNAFIVEKTGHEVIIKEQRFFYPWPAFLYVRQEHTCCIPRCLHFRPS